VAALYVTFGSASKGKTLSITSNDPSEYSSAITGGDADLCHDPAKKALQYGSVMLPACGRRIVRTLKLPGLTAGFAITAARTWPCVTLASAVRAAVVIHELSSVELMRCETFVFVPQSVPDGSPFEFTVSILTSTVAPVVTVPVRKWTFRIDPVLGTATMYEAFSLAASQSMFP
jgi:hypothetical protein